MYTQISFGFGCIPFEFGPFLFGIAGLERHM
jgi:hypothetical protein